MKRKTWMILLGGIAFFVGQGFIRLPLLQRMPFSWTVYFQKFPIAYWIFLGFSAGIAEEGMTFLVKSVGIKSALRQDGFCFGLGRWVCEIILLLLMAENARIPFIAYVERGLVFFFQTGVTMLIWKGFAKGEKWRYLMYAIFFHGILDASIGLWWALGIHPWGIEGILALMCGLTFYVGWKGWNQDEKNNAFA